MFLPEMLLPFWQQRAETRTAGGVAAARYVTTEDGEDENGFIFVRYPAVGGPSPQFISDGSGERIGHVEDIRVPKTQRRRGEQ